VVALVVSVILAAGSAVVAEPWDIALLVAAAALGGVALASFLASRTA
jgi:hypothetical protein